MTKTFTRVMGISVACLLAFGLKQAAFADEDVSKQLAKADELLKAGKAKAASEILKEATRLNPDSAQAHMQLGAALATQVEKDDYDTAILEEQQALKLDPKSFGARIILGHIYANLNKGPESINILKEACAIKPTSYGAHRDLGIACLSAGKVDEAIAAFKKATELKPAAPEAHLKLAILLSKKGNFRDALSEANEAVHAAPSDPEAYVALGNIMLESGDEAGCIDPFKDALRYCGKGANPITTANALSGLGWALAAKDKLDEGIINEKKAIKTCPIFLPAYVRLGDMLSKEDKNSEAEDCYKTALKISPEDAGVGTSYGKFLDHIGRKADARAALKKVLEKSPHFKPANDALAALDQQVKTK